MCLPWNHKWETISHDVDEIYRWRDYKYSELPIAKLHTITQRCTHCGKEIVRKYRV